MRFIIFFLFLNFLAAFNSALAMGHGPGTQVKSEQSPLIGKPAPDAVLTKTDGSSAHILGASGKKRILIFWATWCPHCYEELGNLNEQLSGIEKAGIQVTLINISEAKPDVINYFKQRRMKLVSFVDEDSSLQGPYRLVGVPTLFFIDEKGIICRITHAFPSDYQQSF